ncbi:MAG: TIM barrel protein [bacterium]
MDNLGIVIAKVENLRLIEETGLRRAEFVIFDPDHKDDLLRFISEHRICFSVHCPLFRPNSYPEHPLLACILDVDADRRRRSFNLIRTTMEEGAEMGAEYTVVHLQRPAHFSGDDLTNVTEQQLLDSLHAACDELAALADKIGMPVRVENLFDHPLFYEASSYQKMFEEFPALGFCLDVGHLDVDSRRFGFDFMDFIHTLLPYTRAVHLQNSRSGNEGFESRYWKAPVHPSQNPSEGWRDIPAVLRTILTRNPDCVVNFEAKPDYYPTRDFMLEGIKWAAGIFASIQTELNKH